jgi:hypothetical protein
MLLDTPWQLPDRHHRGCRIEGKEKKKKSRLKDEIKIN